MVKCLFFALRVQGQQFFLCVLDLRGPDSFVFIKLYGRRMIRQGHVGGRSALPRPIFELRVQGRKLLNILPESFQRSLNGLSGKRFVTDEVYVIGKNTGVANDSCGRSGLEGSWIVTWHCFFDPLFSLGGTVQRNKADPDGSIGLLYFGGANRMVAYVSPSLH